MQRCVEQRSGWLSGRLSKRIAGSDAGAGPSHGGSSATLP